MSTKLHPNDPLRAVDFAWEMGPQTAARDLERFAFEFFVGLGEAREMTREAASTTYVRLWDTAASQKFHKGC